MKMYRNYKFCLLIYFTIISAVSRAQGVGVGTRNPHSSTVLEVSSSIKKGGVLMPKVNLKNATDVLTIPNPAVGLMVYNTNTAGTKPNQVEAYHHYFWNGTRWNDIADINIIKNLLLPQVFFCQESAEQIFSTANLSTINSGGDLLIIFNNTNVLTNNGENVTLNNNLFTINNTGEYEVSGFVNYNPEISNYNNSNTNILYKVQKSTNGGASWTTVAQTTSVWGKMTGGNSRTLISPPSIIQFNKNDMLRAIVTKTYGANHGSGARVSVPNGLTFSKNIRILKLD